MTIFIDRRINKNKKNSINKKRFIDRNAERIDKSIKKIISDSTIKDLSNENNEFEISIETDGIKEPRLSKDLSTGDNERVHPHNDQFTVGDRIKKQESGQGQGSGNGDASDNGSGEDSYEFKLSQEDFLEYLFENMELPNLNKTNIKNSEETITQRAGFTTTGNPASLCIKNSYIKSLARKIAVEASFEKKINRLKEENASAEEIKELERKKEKVPFIMENDLMYKNRKKVIKPSTQAVIFCVMDISGSVTQEAKEISKVFFLLLYLFLNKNYKNVEIRFISHTTIAKEVTEKEFFHSKETGGTIVSSAFEKVCEIIEEDYTSGWNIYVSQSSDGDNVGNDNYTLLKILEEKLLEKINYMTYIEVNSRYETSLEKAYKSILSRSNFNMAKINDRNEIYPTLLKLFQKRS